MDIVARIEDFGAAHGSTANATRILMECTGTFRLLEFARNPDKEGGVYGLAVDMASGGVGVPRRQNDAEDRVKAVADGVLSSTLVRATLLLLLLVLLPSSSSSFLRRRRPPRRR